MRIKVTQECIDNGDPANPRECPVALAMLDAGLRRPIAQVNGLSWKSSDEDLHYWEPTAEVKRFMLDFDKRRQVQAFPRVEPFEFELEVE